MLLGPTSMARGPSFCQNYPVMNLVLVPDKPAVIGDLIDSGLNVAALMFSVVAAARSSRSTRGSLRAPQQQRMRGRRL